jgi:hypothetical protein
VICLFRNNGLRLFAKLSDALDAIPQLRAA